MKYQIQVSKEYILNASELDAKIAELIASEHNINSVNIIQEE